LQYADQAAVTRLAREMAAIRQDMAAADRASKARLNGEKELAIARYWDEAVKTGVRSQAQEVSFKTLLRKCDFTKIQKFADLPTAGEITELDREARRMLAEPRITVFGDRMPQPAPGDTQRIDPARRERMLAATPVGRAILKDEARALAAKR
jgi:hypothetical protein